MLKLKVEKLILPIDDALTQKIGIISGVLLSVIFLILLVVFVIFAVCKRRRKRSRPPSSTGTEDTSPEEPPIKPIWTTPIGVSNGPPLISRHPKRSHQHHLQVIIRDFFIYFATTNLFSGSLSRLMSSKQLVNSIF